MSLVYDRTAHSPDAALVDQARFLARVYPDECRYIAKRVSAVSFDDFIKDPPKPITVGCTVRGKHSGTYYTVIGLDADRVWVKTSGGLRDQGYTSEYAVVDRVNEAPF